ncbi:MAG: glycosyltransferase, partial [Acidimicrobiales bacterium]
SLVIDGQSDPSDRDTLHRWADEVGVADRLTVQCSDRRDLPGVYRSADVCVFASEWAEPFGLVPLEAMACGVPVVATGVGGSGEFLVDGDNTVLFTPGDPESLAASVRRLIDEPDLRRHVVNQGLILAERFDVDHLTDRFEHLYTEAAEAVVTGS